MGGKSNYSLSPGGIDTLMTMLEMQEAAEKMTNDELANWIHTNLYQVELSIADVARIEHALKKLRTMNEQTRLSCVFGDLVLSILYSKLAGASLFSAIVGEAVVRLGHTEDRDAQAKFKKGS